MKAVFDTNILIDYLIGNLLAKKRNRAVSFPSNQYNYKNGNTSWGNR